MSFMVKFIPISIAYTIIVVPMNLVGGCSMDWLEPFFGPYALFFYKVS